MRARARTRPSLFIAGINRGGARLGRVDAGVDGWLAGWPARVLDGLFGGGSREGCIRGLSFSFCGLDVLSPFFFFFFFFFQKEISLPFRSVLNVLSSGFSSDLVHCFVYIFIVSGSLPFPKIFLGVVALTKPPNLNHILTPLSRPE
ncbi:hypothetical protein IWX47DRAFT_141641 [Phyllosticta citricarpa]